MPPRDGNTKVLQSGWIAPFSGQLGNGGKFIDHHHLEKIYTFDDFQGALNFTNQVGEWAESIDNQPGICLTRGKANVTIWTHSVGGLSEADFVFAAHADQLQLDSGTLRCRIR